jgi:DNA-binding transcriptional LysR family regulator
MVYGYSGQVFLAQLEGFVEVARLGTITRAADALAVSQPALSARLKSLEDELGSSLFTRTRRGVRLTPAGRAFLAHAERILLETERGTQELAELRTSGGDAVVLGATLGVTFTLLPLALRRFRDEHADARISVRSALSAQHLVDMVLRGEVALGLTRELQHPDLERIPLYDDPLLVVAPRGHRFAASGRTRLHELKDEELIVYDANAPERERVLTVLKGFGVVPRRTTTIDTVEGAKRLVEEGLGVAVLPATSVRGELRLGSIVPIVITDARLPSRAVIAVRRNDAGPLPKDLHSIVVTLRELGRESRVVR